MKLAFLIVALSVAGCAATSGSVTPPPADAVVRNSIGYRVPEGVEQGYIYQIDGEVVSYLKDAHILAPGKHRFRVWPREDMAESLIMIPDQVRIEREEITVGEIEIDLQPGYYYWLGARTNVGRTFIEAGADTISSSPRKYVSPTLIRAIKPKTIEEGAKGMSVFFGLLGLGPLAAGGL